MRFGANLTVKNVNCVVTCVYGQFRTDVLTYKLYSTFNNTRALECWVPSQCHLERHD